MLWIVLVTIFFLLVNPLSAGKIPPAPAKDGVGDFTHDYNGLLTPNDVSQIAAHQKEAFDNHGVPIIVVTIHRMAQYGYQGDDIQTFARQWFKKWQIGSGSSNEGILVLVSVGDRKARIELGAGWGRRWDAPTDIT